MYGNNNTVMYCGEFEESKKNGKGILYLNGGYVVSEWKNDLQNGHGKLTKKSGDIFEGSFKNGHVEGEVIIHYSDGSKFKGAYRQGKRHGAAIEETKNGLRWEGSYKNDVRDGKFVEKDRNGQITGSGVYEDGKRIDD